MKKFFSVLAVTALLVAPAQALAVANPYDFFPDTTEMLFEGHLTPGIQARMPQVIDEIKRETQRDTEMSISDSALKFILTKALANETIYVGGKMASESSIIVVTKMSSQEWTGLTSNAEPTVYKTASVLDLEEEGGFPGALGYVDGYLVVSHDMTSLKATIDQQSDVGTKTLLGRSEQFQSLRRNFPEAPAAFMYIDIESLVNQAKQELDESDEMTQVFDSISFISKEALSVAETATGYVLDIHATGNPTAMAAQQMTTLNPAGNFTPTLYKQFPQLAPLLYVEGTNLKASYDQTLKTYKEMGLPVEDGLAEIKKESGIDVTKIMNVLTQEYAFGIQRGSETMWPYVTYMARVSQHQAEALTLVNELHDVIETFIMDIGGAEITKDGVWFSQSRTGSNMYTINVQRGSQGGTNLDQFKGLSLTYGVTQDGRFVVSNYPWINAIPSGQTLGQQNDFATFIATVPASVSSYGYLSMRNVWGMVDNFLAHLDTLGLRESPGLNFYKDYYEVLETIYAWKDSTFITTGDAQNVHVKLSVGIDKATHPTFSQYVSERQKLDSDNDGVSDLKEEFLYHTPVHSADCDEDGISDIAAIRKGNDPCGKGQPSFEDLGSGAFYNEHVGLLKQRNIIKGYPDGTFQPGRNVNRAEFVTMVMHAFGSTNFSSNYVPFDDVSSDAWYISELSDAYRSGVVDYNRNFRPGDTITRAEAVAMVTRASAVFSSQTEFSAPFDDLPRDAWFNEPVGRAYSLGVVTGKGNRTFDPMGKLTRAEAATLISRTLSQEVEQLKNMKNTKPASLPSLLLKEAF